MAPGGTPLRRGPREPVTGPGQDRGPEFAGVRIGRPATGALLDAGYATLADLPADLDTLLELHGVGPRAVRLLRDAVADRA